MHNTEQIKLVSSVHFSIIGRWQVDGTTPALGPRESCLYRDARQALNEQEFLGRYRKEGLKVPEPVPTSTAYRMPDCSHPHGVP